MISYPLTHPLLLEALAADGHGSRILLADGNYAHRTNTNPAARLVYLNLRPGLLTVDQVLDAILSACPIEAAAMMRCDDGSTPPPSAGYQDRLGDAIRIDMLDRADFYKACRAPELTLAVATGDTRYFANIVLTIGALPEA